MEIPGRRVIPENQAKSVIKIGTQATNRAVSPDGMYRSAKVTAPFPPSIKQPPTMHASRQTAIPGHRAPRNEATTIMISPALTKRPAP
jgi:hypothetical protein